MWEINSLVWFELNSKTPSLLNAKLDFYCNVPHEFLNSRPPVDLQPNTVKELLGLRPSDKISGFGTAKIGCPAASAFLTAETSSLSVAKYFLIGAPVRSLRKFYLGVGLEKTL